MYQELDDYQKEKIFVYGSLMEGFWNYRRLLEGQIENIEYGELSGKLYYLPEGYPALAMGDRIVKGEVMELPNKELLKTLDRLEGYIGNCENNLYNRTIVEVKLTDGSTQKCWVYVYCDKEYVVAKGTLIPDGDWRSFMSRK